jgi:hypothetical protein
VYVTVRDIVLGILNNEFSYEDIMTIRNLFDQAKDGFNQTVKALRQVENIDQLGSLLTNFPAAFMWSKDYYTEEIKAIKAGDFSKSDFFSLNEGGIRLCVPTRVSNARDGYRANVDKIDAKLDKEIEAGERIGRAKETEHITKAFISMTEPRPGYEGDFSPEKVDARVKRLIEWNKEYCGGVSTDLAEKIKEAADYQKNYFKNLDIAADDKYFGKLNSTAATARNNLLSIRQASGTSPAPK